MLLGAGKIVYGIVRYYLRERKPERQFRHPELGMFTSDGTVWTCVVRRDGRDIRIHIGGTENAPDTRLLAEAQGILRRFAEEERRAIEFLRSSESEIRDAVIEFYGIDFIDEQHPDRCTFEFIDPCNTARVWRVEFMDGAPRHTGFDD